MYDLLPVLLVGVLAYECGKRNRCGFGRTCGCRPACAPLCRCGGISSSRCSSCYPVGYPRTGWW